MTRARAPGKVVISGAYAVLAGAPAIVSAVTRYVVADASRPATFVTDEVRAALAPGERPPWFDASELREGDRKLGLGSSAAILVASLFALELVREAADGQAPELARVNERAMQAHRQAQGGGSGIDVAASTFGGTFIYRLGPHGASIQPVALPARMTVELWTCPTSAATRDLLVAVAQLAERSPEQYARWMGSQILAAHDAARAAVRQDARALIAALRAQSRALSGLGNEARVPIVTPALSTLAPRAEAEGGALLPAGAGGGDIALFVSCGPSSSELRDALEIHGHRRLATELGAPGVSVVV